MSIRQMTIEIPDGDIEDLRRRLNSVRWPPPIAGSDWADGTDGDYLRDVVKYWATQYNWRERETLLNKLNHFVTEIDGMRIHFIHAKAEGSSSVPLLLLHGWPSSFVQMLDVIPLLTEQRSDGTHSLEVIVASMPGYPFSQIPTQPGMGFARIADILTKLMVDELGFTRFAGRGSDQGALVLQQIGLKHPQHLIGLHRHGVTPFANFMPVDLTPAEIEYQKNVGVWAQRETLYARLQSSSPETLTPAFADSPVALASWILEKFQRWGDGENGIDAQFGRDRLLDNLSLHWFTGTGAASIRLYREVLRDLGTPGRVEVPTAIMMPLRDGVNLPAPREWAERSYNVQRWTVMEHGGHFPEWEVPHAVANDVRHFYAGLLS